MVIIHISKTKFAKLPLPSSEVTKPQNIFYFISSNISLNRVLYRASNCLCICRLTHIVLFMHSLASRSYTQH